MRLLHYFLMVSLLSLSGCETSDRALSTAERMLGSTTGRTVVDLAQGKDPQQILKKRTDVYQRNPEALIRDLRAIQRDFQLVMDALTGKVRQTWGEKEVKVPERKRYVKYTQNYMSRAIVDFDRGTVLIETLDDKTPQTSLKNAIVTTLLTPHDPRAVDLFSDKAVSLTDDKEPYLFGLIVDQQGQTIRTPESAERFADYLIERRANTRVVDQNGTKKSALFAQITMVQNFSNRQADKYRPVVTRFADQFGISSS
ncbi:MAG TPA: murein transglycosylase domain-containing protein, partial [Nitrospira sp.]|nr:murein transglycosylase domain-containing protein [Nitrospira sp.]